MYYFSRSKKINWFLQNFDFCRISMISFCRRRGFLILQKIADFRTISARALLGVERSRRDVWNIQETKEKTHVKHLGVRPPLSRQQALSELQFCRIRQISAEIYRILQDSAEFCRMPKSPKIADSARIKVIVPLTALLIYFAGIFFKIGIFKLSGQPSVFCRILGG